MFPHDPTPLTALSAVPGREEVCEVSVLLALVLSKNGEDENYKWGNGTQKGFRHHQKLACAHDPRASGSLGATLEGWQVRIGKVAGVVHNSIEPLPAGFNIVCAQRGDRDGVAWTPKRVSHRCIRWLSVVRSRSHMGSNAPPSAEAGTRHRPTTMATRTLPAPPSAPLCLSGSGGLLADGMARLEAWPQQPLLPLVR